MSSCTSDERTCKIGIIVSKIELSSDAWRLLQTTKYIPLENVPIFNNDSLSAVFQNSV